MGAVVEIEQSLSGAVILIVEDEPFVRMLAVDILEERGATIHEASDAAEALHLMETERAIDLVFTDITMPGEMDGLTLARCIQERCPSVAIVLTSGVQRPSGSELPSRGIFLPKPYRSDDLVRTVESQLRRAA